MPTRLGLLVLAALLAGLVHSALEPLQLRLPATSPKSSGPQSPEGEIDYETARRLHQDSTVVFIDASSATDYQRGRIPGAIHLQPADFALSFPPVLQQIAHGAKIVVYCSGPDCDAALLVAIRLRESGFPNAMVFPGGLKAWKAAGAPIES